MLPIVQLPREDFTFKDGTILQIRGLSRAEALQLQGLTNDVLAVEILCIKAATGVNEDEAKAWHSATPNDEVERLINAVAKLSGLDGASGKADAEGLHSANLTELITSLQKISDALSQKSEGSPAPK